MNDDWDGVDWADYFSGPDDYEIKKAQKAQYKSSVDDDDTYMTYDAGQVVSVELSDTSHCENPANIVYSLDFDNIKEVNVFTSYMRSHGAKEIKVSKHGPLPAMDVYGQDRFLNLKSFTVTFQAHPIPEISTYGEGPCWQVFRAFFILDQFSKLGYLAIQIKDDLISNHLIRLDRDVSIFKDQGISEHTSTLIEVAKLVKTDLAESGESGNCLDSDCSEHNNFGSMFHFDFIKRVIHYLFYDKGFSRRVADKRVWNLDDGELFKEISQKYPFDADGLDQRDFFYENRLKYEGPPWDHRSSLNVRLEAERRSYSGGYGTDRLDGMIDSIDRTIGQKPLQDGETNSTCFVAIDYTARIIEFERRFYTPVNRTFRSGSLTFDSFVFMAYRSLVE